MTPKPEIAAMEALKKRYNDFQSEKCLCTTCVGITAHNAAIDACIATLSNHVVIPEGEFAGIVSTLRGATVLPKTEGDKKHNERLYDAIAIAQKYAPEGKDADR